MKSSASFLGLLALFVVSLAVGSRHIPLPELLDPSVHHIVFGMRVPRGLVAMFVGASLALAGLLTQTWTRNPLADPGIVGITAGARFLVAVGSLLGVTALWLQGAFALVGALLATLLVLAVARTVSDPLTLILVGVGVNATLMALTMLLALQSQDVFNDMRSWSVGSTIGRGYGHVWVALIGLLIAAVIAFVVSRDLDILGMGADSAAALGISVPRTLSLVVSALVIAAGTATAVVGPVAFLGLAAPHMVPGASVRRRLVPVMLVGATLALLADIIGRLLMHPGEVEFSVVLAVIGAPLMIWLIRR
ncbi:Ferric enterobactin transport system permease protein FepD [Corynebacterium kalinowskii]|uniref:Ferric enterobactin transport system permease protein FepD n=1 Tax=Corynebacterium kalinowskii TaxID=2675216 RepID=A0A6B8VJ64_9CORY|nr:iron ABC transporter permease [Corynebacterium kalinowskii]QGU01514.1 Ferric enterobactin transport system permease protein FepD [Corynebacterium kalinowskii]